MTPRNLDRYDDQALRVHDQALREALQLGSNHIGPMHLLLAICEEPGVTARALQRLGITAEALRKSVLEQYGDELRGTTYRAKHAQSPSKFTQDVARAFAEALKEARGSLLQA